MLGRGLEIIRNVKSTGSLQLSKQGLNSNGYIRQLMLNITLGYYRNRLYIISITFTFTTEEQDVEIQRKLKELFGNTKISHNVRMNDDATYEWVMQWESKNVLLQFEKYDYSNSKSKLWSSDIYLYSKRIRNEINNDSF